MVWINFLLLSISSKYHSYIQSELDYAVSKNSISNNFLNNSDNLKKTKNFDEKILTRPSVKATGGLSSGMLPPMGSICRPSTND